MARKPKPNQPQGDESAATKVAPLTSEVPAGRAGPKRTVHDHGIVSLDF
ncbi:hypothetical protein GGE56_006633 [Rhizobium leguminosarum]|uniref:Uncharacterized protein n=1 Tax=Rhizobium phage RHEph01 TaxID=1220601 RepID=L7TMM4_9CAUD|nr:hypothetical protein HOQ88_gp33 [Rhizobium phage RHEph01]AGC35544.1 hypothetical protein RHEph01_gp033 [Rhizobium phage RHEph01]MBB4345221.1 hypothetical protein [Rhizobium leguminosarum]MBB6298292.1 hypothetical protein [Rhizobium leguminosarum]GGD98034.1 hypothetical protein GCM10008012_47080 [Rhizobium anhuiense]